jgi:hypothetical protein
MEKIIGIFRDYANVPKKIKKQKTKHKVTATTNFSKSKPVLTASQHSNSFKINYALCICRLNKD